ncbi:type IV secretion system protein [Paracoccus laeviglucosivorans]|uniref:Type IV secretory pathway, VirB6 components n=1 Tax=Paracoccus laeviglucosivorans TaxID=1197861 RepID=A0A521FSW3_9RHOB|nr:type IV secretion system protein [Paracoccus laeviglucosivorans]SMO99174.1 Type IV secretory pathway, VirB6 components [Paracoccus laeviglucosivorans]
MGLVTDILGSLDESVKSTGQALFENTASALGPIWVIMLTFLLLVIGMNMAMGIYRMSARESVAIATRIFLVFLFGFSWHNFGTFYDALTQASGNLALSFFDAASSQSGGINTAMDNLSLNMGDATDGVMKSMGSIARGVLGAFFYVILALLMAAYILIVGFAKIMIAFLLGVAPLAMIFTIFERTKPLFEAWLSSFVSYLMYPIAASAVVASVVHMAGAQFQRQTDVQNIAGILGFLVVVFVGIYALLKIPEAAQNITGQMRLASIVPEALRLTGSTAGRLGSGVQGGIARGASALGAGSAGAALAYPAQAAKGLIGDSQRGTHQRSAREAGQLLRAKLNAVTAFRGK